MSQIRHSAPLILIVLTTVAVGCTEKGARIGAIVSETGELGIYGKEVKRGIELAREQINAEGGFSGGPVELVYRDDKSSPAVAEKEITELIDAEEIEVLIGGVSSDVMLAIAPIAQQRKAVLMSPSASAPAITDAGDFVFRNYPSDVLEGTSMADFAREQGLENIAIFSEANKWGAGLTGVFRSRFESRRRNSQLFELSRDADIAQMIANVKDMNPDGVYLVTYAEATNEILPLLRAAGIHAVFMGTSSLRPQVIAELGDAADKLVLTRPAFDGESEDERMRAFVEAYRKKYAGDPDIYSAHGYDALMLLWNAMKDGNSSDADEVRRALYKIEGFQGAAGRTSFDDKGDVVRYPRLFVVQAGTTMPYADFKEQGGTL